MIRPRWRKVFSDLWGNRSRSLLVVASITVGLFAVGVITTLHMVMSEDMQGGYQAANPANIQIVTAPFDQDWVDHIRRMPGVRAAEGATKFSARLEASPGEWIGIDLRGVPEPHGMQINQVTLERGKWPPADREIVLERYKLPDTNAQIGDMVTIELRSGNTRALKLVGVVNDQTIGAFEAGPGFFLAPVQGYVNEDTLNWLEQPDTFNTLYVTVTGDAGDEEHIARIADQLQAEVDEVLGEVISTGIHSSFDHPNRTYVDALVGVLLVLGLLSVFLSGFLIINTLQALLNQQIQQIGIMKTVGASRGQIASVYLALIFVFGVLAALLAMPLAYQVAFQRIPPLALQINFVFFGPRVLPQVLFLQVLIALLVPQLAAVLPIYQGVRTSVQEALSGINQSHPPTRGWFDRQLSRIRRISRPILIAIRNTFRSKGRLILTLITLSLGGAIFIASFNVQASMTDYIDLISRYFLADVNVTLDRPYRIDEMEPLLREVPGVARVEGWGSARTELVLEDGSIGDTIQLLAPPADSQLVEPILLKGRWLLPGDENAIGLNERFMSRYPDLEIGDTIRLRVNGKDSDWVVVGIFQLAGRSAGFLAYANYDYLSQLINLPNRALTFRIVSTQDDMTQEQQEALGRAIEDHLRKRHIGIIDITAGQYLSTTAAQGFSTLTAFLLFLAALTALVGSIGLAGTMSMNVMERTREIGVMRAIGASNGILMRMVLTEGLIIGMLSWLIGTLLAFPISKLLTESISQAIFGMSSAFSITSRGFILWLLAVIVLSTLASLIPARSAARLTIREVLAYE